MDPRISYYQAKAIEVRRLAQTATIEHIRTELLKIADQYDCMAAEIRAQRKGRLLLRKLTVIAVERKSAL